MRRLAVLIAFLAVPAPARAAVNEVAFHPLPDRDPALCLRATGAPGELALLGPFSSQRAAVDLLAAGPDGSTRGARVAFGALSECAATATAPGGAAVVAGVVRGSQVWASWRDPGGAFAKPVRLDGAASDADVSAAVAANGHAVVAWAQLTGRQLDRRRRIRIVAARRTPGGSFGPVEALTPWRAMGEFGDEPEVVSGIDASGTATVAWMRSLPERPRRLGADAVETAIAAPGTTFAVERVGPSGLGHDHLALAVAADGWTLLAYDNPISVFERAPGAGRFAQVPVALPRGRQALSFTAPAVAVREGGGGLVAWRSGTDDPPAGVIAARRASAGPFGRAETVAPARDVAPRGGPTIGAVALPAPPQDDDDRALRAALAPDGRALLAWPALRSVAGARAAMPSVAAGTLADGFGAPARLGSPLRSAKGVAPLFLPDGRAAVAWTDNAEEYEVFSLGGRSGRLHLALESAPEPASPPPPRIVVRAPRRQRLYASDPVRVTVRCDRACDVRARLAASESAATASRDAAGPVRLELGRFEERPRSGRARVIVQTSAPNGRRYVTATRRVRIVDRPALPVPKPLDVRARLRRDAVVVTWRTASPARRTWFVVEGRRTRSRRSAPPDLDWFASVAGRGGKRFRVRLAPRRPDRIRWIAVQAVSRDGGRSPRPVLVRVSGVRSRA